MLIVSFVVRTNKAVFQQNVTAQQMMDNFRNINTLFGSMKIKLYILVLFICLEILN